MRNRISFLANSSYGNTSSVDTLVEQVGVCRDFAHLMIALCRAVNMPARFVTGIDYGADPALGPTDFHAYVEVYLGNRWYLFDPSGVAIPMGLVPWHRPGRCRFGLRHDLRRRARHGAGDSDRGHPECARRVGAARACALRAVYRRAIPSGLTMLPAFGVSARRGR